MNATKKFHKNQRFEVDFSSVAPMPALPVLKTQRAQRKDVALRAWLMSDTRTERGYVMNISMTGVRVTGANGTFSVGSMILLKIQMDPRQPSVTIRSQVTRYQFPKGNGLPELALQFVEIKPAERERLRMHLDSSRAMV